MEIEKFSPGPGFKTRFPALYAGMLPPVPLRQITRPSCH